MIENFYGTFTFALLFTSLAVLGSLIILKYLLWPVLEIILTPIIGGCVALSEIIEKIFERKKEKIDKSSSFGELWIKNFIKNYILISFLFVVLPFVLFINCYQSLILYKSFFTSDLNILIDIIFSLFGLLVYGFAISYALKVFLKDDFKLYVPFGFLFMAVLIINDKFF
jgi:hypothetical protein